MPGIRVHPCSRIQLFSLRIQQLGIYCAFPGNRFDCLPSNQPAGQAICKGFVKKRFPTAFDGTLTRAEGNPNGRGNRYQPQGVAEC
jgi:hypothetical protein